MPATAPIRVGMTRLLRSERIEMPKTDWVGRVGLADMAGKRPLCALGPMMSALNFWSFSFKRKGRKQKVAATDARQHTGRRWHDMAAGAYHT